jgi:protein-tyrosine phosphatase
MSHQLLFVCAANVCRSPLMAVTFAESVAQDRDRTEWTVISRGISVVRKHQMCSLAASLIDGNAYGAAYASSHVSAQVAESELESQDLIVTASREERARLARMLPASRTRTFTLKEAVALGRPHLDANELTKVEALRADGPLTLADYSEFLHQRRGRVPITAPNRVRMPWSTPVDPQDIPDVHHENSKKHASTLKELREYVRTLHDQMGEFFVAEH